MEPPMIIDLGRAADLTEGPEDLVTDNHNGTWKRVKGDAEDNPGHSMIDPAIIDC